MIYLDNAATSFPKPQCVSSAMLYAQKSAANPGRGGHSLSVRSGSIVFKARQKAAQMFDCEEENVIFTKNCTESLNIAIKGLVKEGSHIIVSSLEHNSVIRPVEKLKNTRNIKYDIAFVDAQNDETTLENFEKLIRDDTQMIVCTHVSNVFGTVLPIEKIARLSKKHNIYFVLDAAQSAGNFDISMKDGLFDAVCMPGHKGLFGPMGTGLLLLGREALPDSFTEGGTGSLSLSASQPLVLPDRFESGTVNVPGIAGLSSGLELVEKIGVRNIHAHECMLTKILIEDLKNIKGIVCYDNMHAQKHSSVLSFTVDGMHSEQTAQRLDELGVCVRGGYHCAYIAHKTYKTYENGTVRVSPGFFNTKKDIKYLSFCLNKIAKEQKLC